MRRLSLLLLMLALSPAALAQRPIKRGGAAPAVLSGEARRDADGSPLPPGAVARFGTVRFQHAGDPTFVRFLPGCKVLITALADDGVARAWDAATGREVARVAIEARAALVAPDGAVLFAGEPGIRAWKPGQPAAVPLLGELARLAAEALASSRDGQTLAVATEAATALYDRATGRKLLELNTPKGTTAGVLAFSPDGRWLAGTGGNHGVWLWDLRTGKRLRTYPPRGVSGFALSPDGERIAISSNDGVQLFSTASDEAVEGFGEVASLQHLAFSPDGKSLVGLASGEGTLTRVDARTGKVVENVELEDAAPTASTVAEDGKWIAGGQNGGNVRVWDGRTGKAHEVGRRPPLKRVWVSTDGKTGECLDATGEVRSWDLATGRPGPKQRVRLGAAGHFAWHRGTNRFAAVVGDGPFAVEVTDSKAHKLLVRFPLPAKATEQATGVPKLTFSAGDGDRLAVACDDRLYLIDLPSGKVVRAIESATLPEPLVALSQDGRLAAVAGPDAVPVWEVGTGRRRFEVKSGKNGVVCLAFSPDGRNLLVARNAEPLDLLDLRTGAAVRWNATEPTGPRGFKFSDDGQRLAVGLLSGKVSVVDVRTGETTFRAAGHEGAVNDLAFAPDGQHLLTASDDGTVLVWDTFTHPDSTVPVPAESPTAALAVAALADPDPASAQLGMTYLYHRAEEAVALLAAEVSVPARTEPARLARLVEELNGDDFRVRKAAVQQIEALGGEGTAAVREAAAKSASAEVRKAAAELLARREAPLTRPDELRAVRAAEVLEGIATPEAAKLLARWAAGPPGHRLTAESAAALGRLKPRLPRETP